MDARYLSLGSWANIHASLGYVNPIGVRRLIRFFKEKYFRSIGGLDILTNFREGGQ